jgi:hypothetical protein
MFFLSQTDQLPLFYPILFLLPSELFPSASWQRASLPWPVLPLIPPSCRFWRGIPRSGIFPLVALVPYVSLLFPRWKDGRPQTRACSGLLGVVCLISSCIRYVKDCLRCQAEIEAIKIKMRHYRKKCSKESSNLTVPLRSNQAFHR